MEEQWLRGLGSRAETAFGQRARQLLRDRRPLAARGQCGSVAVEIAQRLRREGEEVALLVLIDVPARYIESSDIRAMRDLAGWIVKLAALIEQSSGSRARHPRGRVARSRGRRSDADPQRADAGHRRNASGADVSNVRGLLNASIANSQARHTPRSVLPAPTTLFRQRSGLRLQRCGRSRCHARNVDDGLAVLSVRGCDGDSNRCRKFSGKYDGRGNCRNEVNGVLIVIDN